MLNLKEIKANIRLIKDAGDKMDIRIHETGVSVLSHAKEHGDWSEMQRLYDALPRSARRQAFVTWVKDNSPLHFDDKLGKFLKSKGNKAEYNVDGANAVPFWDYTKEIVQTLNVDKLLDIEAIIASAYKRIESQENKGAPIEGDMVKFNARVAQIRTALTFA